MTCVICEKRVNVKKHHSYTVLGKRKVGACGEHIKAFSDWIDQQVSKCPDCNTPFKDDAQGFASWNSELFWCECCQEWK